MRLFSLILAASFLHTAAVAQTDGAANSALASQTNAVPKKLAKILANGDGLSRKTAYVVSSIDQEYKILNYLQLKPEVQALVIEGKAYDVFTVKNLTTGEKREVWFDVSKFFGRMF